MKKRYCDFCGQEIPDGTDYYKVSLQKHLNKKQQLIHKADICMNCFNKRTIK